ncbi:hypothetical protein Bhyg_12177 [Pseudolycoriella hygida]|uniref:DUF5641 domain-containing protein n=1 Tax=Pseudolycoriella hygida TaxID=35572 RepID=A0A9Q0MZ30_9DIPT|nr:hypothetical protein Bhyg_12177 [Pseudolycoriella hygida]
MKLAVPCEIAEDAKVLNRNWKTAQMLANHFWTRWLREYLSTITRRTKWFTNVKPIEDGDVVYVVDEKLKRNSWPKGRVTQVFPGNNNIIRYLILHQSFKLQTTLFRTARGKEETNQTSSNFIINCFA